MNKIMLHKRKFRHIKKEIVQPRPETYIDIDINIYKIFNKDLINLTDEELKKHYNTIGIYEYRIYNIDTFNLEFKLNYTTTDEIINYYNENIKNKKTIYIYTPKINNNCGGISALYNLYNLILTSHIFNTQILLFDHGDRTKVLCPKIEISDKDIIIYPEIIYNNPLKGKNIIRWILLGIGIEVPNNIINSWNNFDIVYNWLPMNKELKKYNQLYLPFFNDKFINKNYVRMDNKCYLFKKSINCNLINIELINKIKLQIKKNNEVIIDDLKSTEEVIEVFNKYKFFYTFDPITAYIPYAMLCGCIPIIEPYKNYTKEEFINNFCSTQLNSLKHGFAYGNFPSEIDFAEKTLDLGIKEALNMFSNDIINYNLSKFINDIDNYYYKNINNNIFTIMDVYSDKLY